MSTTDPPDTLSPEALHARLLALNGLNLDTGLRNVGGQLPVLVRVLGRFVDMYQAGLPDLLQTGDGQEAVRWRAAAHSARGACATLGAQDLVQALASFEHALAHSEHPAALAPQARQLHELCQTWVQALAHALGRH